MNELAYSVYCLLSLRKEWSESLPDVKHLGPHLKTNLDTSTFGFFRQTGAIIKKYLRITHLEKQGRETSHIPVER